MLLDIVAGSQFWQFAFCLSVLHATWNGELIWEQHCKTPLDLSMDAENIWQQENITEHSMTKKLIQNQMGNNPELCLVVLTVLHHMTPL